MTRSSILIGALIGIRLAAMGTARGVEPSAKPDALPATQPADSIDALINQLGDARVRVRMAAADRLKAIGAAAVPKLQEARSSHDPEVQLRAEQLLDAIEHPVVPVEAVPQATGIGNTSLSISVSNGKEVVEVSEPGRTTHIEQSAAGIIMTVRGQIDDHQVTREFKAASAEELRKKNPPAFALYQRYAGGTHLNAVNFVGGIAIQRGVRLQVGGPGGAQPPVFLPPPPRPDARRLGVLTDPAPGPNQGIVITRVFPGSRGALIGIQEKDEIQKINGKDVHTQQDIRQLLTGRPEGLTIEGTRDGKPFKLEEGK